MKVLDKVKMLIAGLAMVAVSAAAIAPVPAMAVGVGDLSKYMTSTGTSGDQDTVWGTIKKGLNLLMGIIGVLSVIMIIYGGFQYMTSAGDSSKVTKAKNIIMYGIVGLVIAVLASAIVNLVISSVLQ